MKVCTKCKIEKPCSEFNKHLARADGFSSDCKVCNKESCAAKYASSREKRAAYASDYYSARRDKFSVKNAEYRASNITKIAEMKAAWYFKNKDRETEKMSAYRKLNLAHLKEKSAAYRTANPDKAAARSRNRRARKRGAEGKHTPADVRAIFEAQRGLCSNCQTKLFKSGAKKYHVDHIMPLALGGSNWPANLQCLCPTCNLSKGAKRPDEWAKQQGRLL